GSRKNGLIVPSGFLLGRTSGAMLLQVPRSPTLSWSRFMVSRSEWSKRSLRNGEHRVAARRRRRRHLFLQHVPVLHELPALHAKDVHGNERLLGPADIAP